MSLRSGENLNNLLLIEIEIEEENIKRGLTHNSYIGAVVIHKLKIENLVAVYQINYDNNDDLKWFYPSVRIVKHYKENILFKEDFSCRKTKIWG